MKKQVIIGQFGETDTINIEMSVSEQSTVFPLLDADNSIGFGIGRVLKELTSKGIYPTDSGLDLMILAAHVYAADTRISRAKHSQDTWTREIKLIVPVSDFLIWGQAKSDLVRLLNYLTGDIWNIEFRPRPPESKKLISDRPLELVPPSYDKVQLFSGGLDSLIGAIDNLEGNNSPLLVSHAGDGATSDAQNNCFNILKENYKNNVFERLRLWMNIPTNFISKDEIENTTRGRSFLFFSLGVFAGTGLVQPFTLETPENGLIALNVPLDVLRLGSLSTHTTHPFYMSLWNNILSKLDINGNIVNPYWKNTKGEMVISCKNQALLQQLIPITLSCSSPSKGRWKGLGIEHCGYCLPCLIRRASIKKSTTISDTTNYSLENLTANDLNTMQSEGQQVRSFQFAIKKLKEKPALAKLLIHKSGPLTNDPYVLHDLAQVYFKGLVEVDDLLKNVRTTPQS